MERIVHYGRFWVCHWFQREDRAWFLKVDIPRLLIFVLHRGLDLDDIDARDIVGYYFDDKANRSVGMITHKKGANYDERHFLGYAEPTREFFIWFESLMG